MKCQFIVQYVTSRGLKLFEVNCLGISSVSWCKCSANMGGIDKQ